MDTVGRVGALVGGRYRLRELAGQGGMAEVWRADSIGAAGFTREVAIKRVLPHLLDDAGFRQMFIEEARVGALLTHPNIIHVYDFGEDADGLYLAMEWVDGVTVRELCDRSIAQGRMVDPALAAGVGIEVLRALVAAHGHRERDASGTPGRIAPIVHRDVTPSNVLLGSAGLAKLADFGLARAFDRARMTPDGIVKGKIAYLAPEQLRGAEPTTSVDIYATGIVLWEMIAGTRLHQGRSDAEILRRMLDRTPHTPLREVRDDVPEALAAAVDRAIALEPERRHASAAGFARELRAALRTVDPLRADADAIATEVNLARAPRADAPASEVREIDPHDIPVEYAEGSVQWLLEEAARAAS